MRETGALDQVLPEAAGPARLAALVAVEDCTDSVDPMRRLAALIAGGAAQADAVALRLRLSGAQRRRLVTLTGSIVYPDPTLSARDRRRLLYRLGRDLGRDLSLLAWADAVAAGTARIEHECDGWRVLADEAARWDAPRFPITGRDVLALGIPAGPRVGRILAALERDWIAADFAPARKRLLADLRARLAARDDTADIEGVTSVRICFVGDSLTNGTLDDAGLGWPGRLVAAERACGHDLTLYNLGVRAETTADIARRWCAECAPRLPDDFAGALVFAFGINDTVEDPGTGIRVPHDRSCENACAIIGAAAAWKPTLWVGPTPAEMARQPYSPGPGISFRFDNARTAALSRAYADLAGDLAVPLSRSLHAALRWARMGGRAGRRATACTRRPRATR